jgi:hypothetical protein
MARSAIQLVARAQGAVGKNLKEEIDDLADKALILPIMKEWAHEVRVSYGIISACLRAPAATSPF